MGLQGIKNQLLPSYNFSVHHFYLVSLVDEILAKEFVKVANQ